MKKILIKGIAAALVALGSYLADKNMPYKAKNIDESSQYSAEFEQLNYQTIPLIVTADKVMIGFHQAEVDKLIAQYRL